MSSSCKQANKKYTRLIRLNMRSSAPVDASLLLHLDMLLLQEAR
jgi:hypothetical protein